jgi:hypothetical protein
VPDLQWNPFAVVSSLGVEPHGSVLLIPPDGVNVLGVIACALGQKLRTGDLECVASVEPSDHVGLDVVVDASELATQWSVEQMDANDLAMSTWQ